MMTATQRTRLIDGLTNLKKNHPLAYKSVIHLVNAFAKKHGEEEVKAGVDPGKLAALIELILKYAPMVLDMVMKIINAFK
jgi:hypothetical protein